MLRSEWNKLLLRRRGLLLILLLLAGELLFMVLFTKPYNATIEDNRQVYDRSLAQVEGKLTPEKRQWLESEMERLNLVHQQLGQVQADYYAGLLEEGEFRREYEKLLAEDETFAGFSQLYTQYLHVREAEDRYFLYTGGWEVLLGKFTPDYLFLLVLVFLLTPVFCQEYGCGMDELLLTQAKSAKTQWKAKVLLGLLLTAGLTALIQLMFLVYCALRFGLPHWDYTLSSLISFGTTEKSMTLAQAFALQFGLKLLGYLTAAMVVLAFSVLLRKTALVLMASMVVLVLPLLSVQNAAQLLLIPGPWALSIGSIYLKSHLYLSGSQVCQAPEVGWGQLALLSAVTLGIGGLLGLCIRQKNRNHHIRGRKIGAMVAAGCVVFSLCGCAPRENATIFNSKSASWAETDRYLVFSLGLEGTKLLDKGENRLMDFPLDAFQGLSTSAGSSFYLDGSRLYYLKNTNQLLSGESSESYAHTALMSLDFSTMEEKSVHPQNWDGKWFFDLLPLPNWESDFRFIGAFFLHNGEFYYDDGTDLQAMNLSTGVSRQVKKELGAANFAYDGQNLYYTDHYARLVMENLDTGHREVSEVVVATDFLLTPEGIYFLNARDHSTLYRWVPGEAEPEKLSDASGYTLYWDENYCWVADVTSLYRMNHQGKELVTAEFPGFLLCMPHGSTFFTRDVDGALYQVDKATFAVTTP